MKSSKALKALKLIVQLHHNPSGSIDKIKLAPKTLEQLLTAIDEQETTTFVKVKKEEQPTSTTKVKIDVKFNYETVYSIAIACYTQLEFEEAPKVLYFQGFHYHKSHWDSEEIEAVYRPLTYEVSGLEATVIK